MDLIPCNRGRLPVKDSTSNADGSRGVVVRHVRRVAWGTVLALVALRMITGFHFFRQGTEKLEYNPRTGETRIAFAGTEPFLRGAVGPWADFYKRDLPTFHDWERLLNVPTDATTPSEEQAAENAKWDAEYKKRVDAATAKKEVAPVEFAPYLRAGKWGEQTAKDWTAKVARFKSLPGITEDQRKAADKALNIRLTQLAVIITGLDAEIADWQHELWRLKVLNDEPTAASLPFAEVRITEKQAETKAATAGWVAEVKSLEADLDADLRAGLDAEQASNPALLDQFAVAVADPKEQKMRTVNTVVTCAIIGIGACLILGLATRLAALGGIVFLVMVMASQPPWVAGAKSDVFYYQLVEVAAFFVLFVVGAGRWAGLDFILRALLRRRRVPKELP
jgi:uncharacterized membrane protein YphA (DoxX/SURF4 family)